MIWKSVAKVGFGYGWVKSGSNYKFIAVAQYTPAPNIRVPGPDYYKLYK